MIQFNYSKYFKKKKLLKSYFKFTLYQVQDLLIGKGVWVDNHIETIKRIIVVDDMRFEDACAKQYNEETNSLKNFYNGNEDEEVQFIGTNLGQDGIGGLYDFYSIYEHITTLEESVLQNFINTLKELNKSNQKIFTTEIERLIAHSFSSLSHINKTNFQGKSIIHEEEESVIDLLLTSYRNLNIGITRLKESLFGNECKPLELPSKKENSPSNQQDGEQNEYQLKIDKYKAYLSEIDVLNYLERQYPEHSNLLIIYLAKINRLQDDFPVLTLNSFPRYFSFCTLIGLDKELMSKNDNNSTVVGKILLKLNLFFQSDLLKEKNAKDNFTRYLNNNKINDRNYPLNHLKVILDKLADKVGIPIDKLFEPTLLHNGKYKLPEY